MAIGTHFSRESMQFKDHNSLIAFLIPVIMLVVGLVAALFMPALQNLAHRGAAVSPTTRLTAIEFVTVSDSTGFVTGRVFVLDSTDTLPRERLVAGLRAFDAASPGRCYEFRSHCKIWGDTTIQRAFDSAGITVKHFWVPTSFSDPFIDLYADPDD